MIEKFKNFIDLLWTRLVVTKKNTVEYYRVMGRFYGNANFRWQDIALLSQYLFRSPYKINKQFLLKRGEKEVYTYGETPLTTLEKIVDACQIGPKDHVIELGCGRGRVCYWLHHIKGCTVKGIDYIPEFIEKANLVRKKFHVKGVSFECCDLLEADLEGATVIYLYGTCLEDEYIRKLAEKFKTLPSGAKIVTVSYPLTDYAADVDFEIMKRFPLEFTWGSADVYLQIRK